MDESKLADELQKEANIERIKQVVERVNQQKAIENSDNKEVDFESLNFYGDDSN